MSKLNISNPNIFIVFDTETTGFSPVKNEIVQLSYILYNTQSQTVIYATQQGRDIVKINGRIPKQTSDVHGITKNMTLDKRPIKEHIDEFIYYCDQATTLVGHNIGFDIRMIEGQINKIIRDFPEEADKYNDFLTRFQIIGKNLPVSAFCTMKNSKNICDKSNAIQKIKNKKLVEVHQLLFDEDVGGTLHNALVDISVTLRVFLKLTMDLDICKDISEYDDDIDDIKNNNDICSLIKPRRITKKITNVNFSGELIKGVSFFPDETLSEEIIVVKELASSFAKDIQDNAITNIIVSSSVINSSPKKSKSKSKSKKPPKSPKPPKPPKPIKIKIPKIPKIKTIKIPKASKSVKVAPLVENYEEVKATTTKKTALKYVTTLLHNLTSKHKVVPLGGKSKSKSKRNK